MKRINIPNPCDKCKNPIRDSYGACSDDCPEWNAAYNKGVGAQAQLEDCLYEFGKLEEINVKLHTELLALKKACKHAKNIVNAVQEYNELCKTSTPPQYVTEGINKMLDVFKSSNDKALAEVK